MQIFCDFPEFLLIGIMHTNTQTFIAYCLHRDVLYLTKMNVNRPTKKGKAWRLITLTSVLIIAIKPYYFKMQNTSHLNKKKTGGIIKTLVSTQATRDTRKRKKDNIIIFYDVCKIVLPTRILMFLCKT